MNRKDPTLKTVHDRARILAVQTPGEPILIADLDRACVDLDPTAYRDAFSMLIGMDLLDDDETTEMGSDRERIVYVNPWDRQKAALTANDRDELQQARKHIENVKRAFYTGERGKNWRDDPLAFGTFEAISAAETMLMMSVVGITTADAVTGVLAQLAAGPKGAKA